MSARRNVNMNRRLKIIISLKVEVRIAYNVPGIGEGGVLLLCPPGAETRF